MRAGDALSVGNCTRAKVRQVFRYAVGCRLDRFLGKTTVMVRLTTEVAVRGYRRPLREARYWVSPTTGHKAL